MTPWTASPCRWSSTWKRGEAPVKLRVDGESPVQGASAAEVQEATPPEGGRA